MSFQSFRPSGFSILPPVVKNLLIINGIFFLATVSLNMSNGFDLTHYLGLHYIGSEAFRPYQFVTYMFMHGSFGHLFFNMFAVWMFGNAIENTWGSKRFLTYYLITGFGAALIHYALVYVDIKPTVDAIQECIAEPSERHLQEFLTSKDYKIANVEMREKMNTFISTYNAASVSDSKQAEKIAIEYLLEYKKDYLNLPNIVGASGALFGLLLAFGMMFPNSLIYVYFAIPIKAKYFVAIYGALELFSGLQNNAADNVAHFAHLGGMLFGFLLIKYWRKTDRNFY